MEQRIYKFLWKGPAKVISNAVINTLEHGGSNLTELQMQIKALRLSWTVRTLVERKGTLESCFNFLLKNYGEPFFLSCNYDINELKPKAYWLLRIAG